MKENTRSIVLMAEFFDPKINSTGLYWFKIAQSLSKKMNVYIISPNIDQKLNKIGCETVPISQSKSFFNFLVPNKFLITIKMLSALLKFKIKDIDFLVGTNPYTLPLAIPIIKLRFSGKVHLLTYDIFPQNLISQTNLLFKQPLYLLSFIYYFAYKQCDRIITVGRDMKKNLINLKYSQPNKIVYIPNWGELISNIGTMPSTDSKLKILFFGNLGRFQAIDEILKQINQVKREDVEFVFAGSGQKDYLIRKAKSKDSRITFLGKIPMSERDKIYKSTHISIVSVKYGMKGLCVPSKAYFSLINSHPILCFVEKESELDILCDDHKCGWIVDVKNNNSLDKILSQIDSEEYKEKYYNVSKIPEDLLNGTKSLDEINTVIV
tara:strand:+ start:16921 stop:18057 length:1137 start_codon:yes stop_codon:yes gene_type:complete